MAITVRAPADTTGPIVTLSTPADGSSSSDVTPTYGGSAGDLADDAPTITVRVYAGATPTGTPLQTHIATRLLSSWTVDGAPALPPGTYSARAEQTDAAGNAGLSTANTFAVTALPGGVPVGPPMALDGDGVLAGVS